MTDSSSMIALVVDGVIAVTVLECAALCGYSAIKGQGVAPADIALSMSAGLLLMSAMSGLAHGLGMAWVASFLLFAGVAHASDMARRWRRERAQRADPASGAMTKRLAS